MKIFIPTLAAILLLSSCGKNEEKASEPGSYATPEAVVLSFVKALNAQDSDGIAATLATKSKEPILGKLREIGGFKQMFEVTKGLQMKLTIIGVDSITEKFTKIYTNQLIDKDTSMHMKFDSIYFSAIKEPTGWKLLSLNARPDKKKEQPLTPKERAKE